MSYLRQYIVTTQMNDTTSKQNLETIVEAIRHLEGDHLFSDQAGPHEVIFCERSIVYQKLKLNYRRLSKRKL